MAFSRRQFIETGSAALIGTAAAQPLLAAVGRLAAPAPVPTPAAPPAPAVAAPPVPARPRVIVDAAVDPAIVQRARAAFDRHRSRLAHTGLVGIADFSKASGAPRFFLLDTSTGRVTKHLVAHGRGSDPGHTGFLQRFSNRVGSEASSDGAYLVGDYYHGKYGRSLRLAGLDPTNSNAETRAIVIHHAWYAEPDQVSAHGRLGRSQGCFAFGRDSYQEVLARLGPGHLLYADRVA